MLRVSLCRNDTIELDSAQSACAKMLSLPFRSDILRQFVFDIGTPVDDLARAVITCLLLEHGPPLAYSPALCLVPIDVSTLQDDKTRRDETRGL